MVQGQSDGWDISMYSRRPKKGPRRAFLTGDGQRRRHRHGVGDVVVSERSRGLDKGV